jgi:hypothetical protein
MERRTFLLGLVGGLAAAAGLAATGSTPAEALPLKAPPAPVPGGADEAADIKPEDLDGVRTEDAQYYIVALHLSAAPPLLAPPVLLVGRYQARIARA